MQTTKSLFHIPFLPANITLLNFLSTLSKKTHLAQNNLTVTLRSTAPADNTTKQKVFAFLQIDGILIQKRRMDIEQL